MKVTLYVVLFQHSWQWQFSLDMPTDYHYWFERRGANRLLEFEPKIPLGQAVAWKEALSREKPVFRKEQVTELLLRTSSSTATTGTIAAGAVTATAAATGMATANTAKTYPLPLSCREVRAGQMVSGKAEQWQEPDESMAEVLRSHLQGRALLQEELLNLLDSLGLSVLAGQWKSYVQSLFLNNAIQLTSGVSMETKRSFLGLKRKHDYRCKRCGSGKDRLFWSACASCGMICAYCEECLTMGRNRLCSLLILGFPAEQSSLADSSAACSPLKAYDDLDSVGSLLEKWDLSPAQREASSAGIRYLLEPSAGQDKPDAAHKPACFLIWAVTGAGKTEMIYPLIETMINGGKRVLVATPRKDVVLELAPRLRQAFPQQRLVTLYGGSDERWETGEITLATTHQLLRFQQAFDLIIIDELDAFPFHNNPMLEYAARKALKPAGKYIFLSATPPAHLQKAVNRKQIAHVKVAVRFHRHPLPVPKLIKMKPLHRIVQHPVGKPRPNQKPNQNQNPNPGSNSDPNSNSNFDIPKSLHHLLQSSLDRGAQIFIFVAKIRLVPLLSVTLQEIYRDCRVEGTSSQDVDRKEKVLAFRSGDIRILVTTTILERGVTVPKTDVFVLEADSALFDEAALVQMAGRAGRSNSDPRGWVYFMAAEKTRSQVRAVKQIRGMNHIAKKKGYLLDDV